HNGEAESPDAAAHEIHAQQAGDHEVDVAGAAFAYLVVRHGNRVRASRGALHRGVRDEPGVPRLRPRVVVAIRHAVRAMWHHEQCDRTGGERAPGGTVAQELHTERGVR